MSIDLGGIGAVLFLVGAAVVVAIGVGWAFSVSGWAGALACGFVALIVGGIMLEVSQ